MIINPKDLIINRKEKQTHQQRALGVVLLVTFWGFFFYLLRPVLIVVGWGIGYYIFKNVAFDIEAQELFQIVFLVYLPVILTLSLIFWAWAAYNRLRFRGPRDKRKMPAPLTSLADIAASCDLPVEALETIRGSRQVTYHFNQEGKIDQVVCLTLEEPVAQITDQRPLFNGELFLNLERDKEPA